MPQYRTALRRIAPVQVVDIQDDPIDARQSRAVSAGRAFHDVHMVSKSRWIMAIRPRYCAACARRPLPDNFPRRASDLDSRSASSAARVFSLANRRRSRASSTLRRARSPLSQCVSVGLELLLVHRLGCVDLALHRRLDPVQAANPRKRRAGPGDGGCHEFTACKRKGAHPIWTSSRVWTTTKTTGIATRAMTRPRIAVCWEASRRSAAATRTPRA